MALEAEKRIGARGLHLAADPAQLSDGFLTKADSIRYLDAGVASSRGGRNLAGLTFPDELPGIPGVAPHTQVIPQMSAGNRCRGVVAFYDQRLETRFVIRPCTVDFTTDLITSVAHGLHYNDIVVFSTTSSMPTSISAGVYYYVIENTADTFFISTTFGGGILNLITSNGSGVQYTQIRTPVVIPQRLNFLFKASGTLQMNQAWTSFIAGDLSFADPNTRAKFIPYSERMFIVDESSEPKVFQRRPLTEQTYLAPVQYDARRMGVVWPTSDTQVPVLVKSADIGALEVGTFAFRIQLENKHGDTSNPSLPVKVTINGITGDTVNQKITINWSTITSTFPSGTNSCARVRIYAQFSARSTSPGQITTQTAPSPWVFIASVPIGTTSFDYGNQQHFTIHNDPILNPSCGAPPRLKDMIMVGDTAYGIAMPDIVYRESTSIGGNRRIVGYDRTVGNVGGRGGIIINPLYDQATIKQLRVDSTDLFVSYPGEPQYMDNSIKLSSGAEQGVGLGALGESLVIFTNAGIKVYDPSTQTLRVVPSNVGCMARDSIVSVDGGILFMGTDGIPRVFNGATIAEVADELLPIFARDDYAGYYPKFDKTNAQEVSCTQAPRRVYMSYPTSQAITYAKPDQTIDTSLARNMAVGDRSVGERTRWSVDSQGFEIVLWLGRESRLLAIDMVGFFYYIEEGLSDDIFTPEGPPYVLGLRWEGQAGIASQFYTMDLDIDTGNAPCTVECRLDGAQAISKSYTFQTQGRETKHLLLPSTFKGRYLDITIYGTPTSRFAFYGRIDEKARRGEFS